jgi:hypothetical protein
MYRMSDNQSNSFKGEADFCNKIWKLERNLPESKHHRFHLQDPILFNTYVVVFFIAPKPNPIKQVNGNEKLHHPKIELAGREEDEEMRNRVWAALVRCKRIKK